MADLLIENNKTLGQYFFICGSDDYLVDHEGRKLYTQHSTGLSNDFSCEIIDADAQNLAKVESIIQRFITSAQMPSLFDEKKIIWLRGINFLADSPIGRAEASKTLVETFLEILPTLNYSKLCLIITATPIDKRTRAFKSLKNTQFFRLIEDTTTTTGLSSLIANELRTSGIQMTQDAEETLISKVNGNSRLLAQEIQKLITFSGKDIKVIDTNIVNEMVSQFGESDFFEFSDAFFSLDLHWTLDALKRYFFTQKESRPLISSALNRLHLLIQLRVLLDSGSIQPNSYSLNKNSLQALASEHKLSLADSADKSAFNVFSQHPWYLTKLAVTAKKIPLKTLIDFQLALIDAFEKIIDQPQEQEEIIHQLVIKCLS